MAEMLQAAFLTPHFMESRDRWNQLWPILLTYMNLIPAWMSNYTYFKVWGEITYLPQLQRCSQWSLRIDKQFHHILCWTRNYLSILGFKLIHISESKKHPWPLTFDYFCIRNYLSTQPSQCHVPHANQVFGGYMMTSSNGNIFRVTGHLCGEFTGPRWIPCTKASDAKLWCFLWSALE